MRVNPPPVRVPAGLPPDLAAWAREFQESARLMFEALRYINITAVSGSPEGVLVGRVGDLAVRTDGGANTTLYVKESGTGNTGWVAK